MKLTFRSLPLFLALLAPLAATLKATAVNPLAGYSFQAMCENTQARIGRLQLCLSSFL